VTDERHATPPADTPAQGSVVAPATAAPAETPARAPSSAVTPGGPHVRRRRSVRPVAGTGARAAQRGRRGLRLEGRTATSYPLRDETRRTVGYLRLIVGQAHIPDEATVAVDVDRITIEWDD
jgi:hypothetical protein